MHHPTVNFNEIDQKNLRNPFMLGSRISRRLFLKVNTLARDVQLFIVANLGIILFILGFVLAVSIFYILEIVPQCCDDINYLDSFSFDERVNLFWDRTTTEGRWTFALFTAVFSGYIVTYLFAFLSVLTTVVTSILIASLWGSKGKTFLIISLLISLNPFLLVLYPYPEVLNPDIKLHIKSDQRAWE